MFPPTAPEFDVPADNLISPDCEDAELPVTSVSDPEFPALDVPVESAMAPLAPLIPAFCVTTNICPLVVAVPRPDVT